LVTRPYAWVRAAICPELAVIPILNVVEAHWILPKCWRNEVEILSISRKETGVEGRNGTGSLALERMEKKIAAAATGGILSSPGKQSGNPG